MLNFDTSYSYKFEANSSKESISLGFFLGEKSPIFLFSHFNSVLQRFNKEWKVLWFKIYTIRKKMFLGILTYFFLCLQLPRYEQTLASTKLHRQPVNYLFLLRWVFLDLLTRCKVFLTSCRCNHSRQIDNAEGPRTSLCSVIFFKTLLWKYFLHAFGVNPY